MLPRFSQEVMENIFRDIAEAEVYIDDMHLHRLLGTAYGNPTSSPTKTTRTWIHCKPIKMRMGSRRSMTGGVLGPG